MNRAIQIQLIGVDERTAAALEIIFKRHPQYTLADEGELTLVDADFKEGREYIANSLGSFDIVMSVAPNIEHQFQIKKPLEVKALTKVLESAYRAKEAEAARQALTERARSKQSTSRSSNAQERLSGYEANPFAKYQDKNYMSNLALREQREAKEKELAEEKNRAAQEAERIAAEKALELEEQRKREAEEKAEQEREEAKRRAEEAERARVEEERRRAAEKAEQERIAAEKARLEEERRAAEEAKALLERTYQEEQAKQEEQTEESSKSELKESLPFTLNEALFRGVKLYELDATQTEASRKIFGQNEDVELSSVPSYIYFESESYLYSHLMGYVKRAEREEANFILHIDRDYFYYDHQEDLLYTSLPEGSLYALSLMPVTERLEAKFSKENAEFGKELRGHNIAYYSLSDALLNLMLLWSARGRLPQGTDLEQKLQIKQKGSDVLASLPLPEIAQIEELWSKEELSLVDLIEQLSLPQRVIFSYYCLAEANNLFTHVESSGKSTHKDLGALLNTLSDI